MMITDLLTESYDLLSPAQKKLAGYLLSNMRQASYLTAKELAKLNDVSEPVVFRLCNKLGLNGYSELQEQLIQAISADRPEVASGGRTRVDQVNQRIVRNLDNKLTAYDDEKIEKIARWIHSFEDVYVMGYGCAFGLASEIFSYLGLLQPNVSFMRNALTDTRGYLKFGPKSLFIAVSFEPHFTYTVRYSELAKKMNSCLLAIADSPVAPVARIGDHSLLVEKEMYGGCMDYDTQWISALLRAVYRNYIDLFPETVAEVREQSDKISDFLATYQGEQTELTRRN